MERLDGYRLRLRKTEEDLCYKEDERCIVADTLKKANAENKSLIGVDKSLCDDLEAANKRDAEWERQLVAAEEKIKSLETRLVSAEDAPTTLAPRRSLPNMPATLSGWLPTTLARGRDSIRLLRVDARSNRLGCRSGWCLRRLLCACFGGLRA